MILGIDAYDLVGWALALVAVLMMVPKAYAWVLFGADSLDEDQ